MASPNFRYERSRFRLPKDKEELAMSTEQTVPNTNHPWEEKEVKYSTKLLATMGAILLALLGGAGVFSLPVFLLSLLAMGNFASTLFNMFLTLAASVLCIFGLVKLLPYVTAQTSVQPKADPTISTILASPFDVRFESNQSGRSFGGDGIVQFQEEHLIVEGFLGASTTDQLVLGGIGAIATGRAGMRKRNISYKDILALSVKGCSVSLSCSGEAPNKIKFRVVSSDGERLYRELYHHYPKAVARWDNLAAMFQSQ